MTIAIGIDLGTVNSCVSVYIDGKSIVIPNELGNMTTPSCIAFYNNETIVGDAAITHQHVYDIKRIIGRKYSDPEIQMILPYLTYTVVADDADNIIIVKPDFSRITPEEVSAHILRKMKQIAENYLGHTVSDAVITIPAYFTDSQRVATCNAGTLAGLNIIRIINEPTAAAIAYGINTLQLDEKTNDGSIVLVYDLGGGTLDVSILEINNDTYHVRACTGKRRLGGVDFDNRLLKYCLSEFCKQNKLTGDVTNNLLSNTKARNNLKRSCENAKHVLSVAQNTHLFVDSFFNGIDLSINISRAKFEQLCSDEFELCMEPIKESLNIAQLSVSQIDDILLVGGATRMPKIQHMIGKFFNKQAKIINPDEIVACGAAIQAYMLSNVGNNSLVLLDTVSLSLGIETAGNVMKVLVPRGTIIPCSHEEIFSTFSDNQSTVRICIFEGEQFYTYDNNTLGIITISNIPLMPKGTARIRVRFDVDNSNILHVSVCAFDKQHKLTVSNDRKCIQERSDVM